MNHKAPNRIRGADQRVYTLRMEPKLLERIHAAAKADQRSVNAWLLRVIEQQLPKP